MTTRTLVFKATDNPLDSPSEEQKRFALLVNRFLTGGNAVHFDPQRGPVARNRDDQRNEARFVRAFKSVSYELRDAEGKLTGERTLKLEGGTLVLEQPTFTLLEKYIAAAPSTTQDADVICDLLDWVSAAEKSND